MLQCACMTTITLRPQQRDAADAIETAWRNGIKRPLVDVCVAGGKSLIFAELARRGWERGERTIITAHTRELVQQNALACRMLMPGVHIGINAAALDERTWRAPVICAAIQSVYKHARNFGQIDNGLGDEAHLWPHSEAGMYHELMRGLPDSRVAGASGTVFRLQGGSLVEGEGAPFDAVVYRYSIMDGIRDGYLCPAFSIGADDKIDEKILRIKQGDFTGASSDPQMIAAMDNHIAQMVHHGQDRRAWLVFEASAKSARAMAQRMHEWGIPTGLVLGETGAAERSATIEAFRAGRLRGLVNINALTTGFDVPHVDLLVMRRPTKSLGLYIQQVGRALRTIGGNIQASIANGKADCSVLDFAGNIDRHGPLDFIRPQDSRPRLVSCEECGKRNAAAAAKCWSCDALMTKLCPACLATIQKGVMDCPHCAHDMRREEASEPKPPALLETPSGAALIAAYRTGAPRRGGWQPVRRAWLQDETHTLDDANGGRWLLSKAMASYAPDARYVRGSVDSAPWAEAILLPNGSSRSSAVQITTDGKQLVVPLPRAAA